MVKHIISFLIIIAICGCKPEDLKDKIFKDKIIGFTDKNKSGNLKPPPYIWDDFKHQGLITERKIEIQGEAVDPMVVQDGIIYIDRSSRTDELFFYNIERNTITQLTAREKAGKKSPIYALRVHNVLYNNGDGTMLPSETKSFAWIEKGDTENKWEIYYGETYKDQSFEAKKIHDFIIPSSDIAKINEYLESLQINSHSVYWAEPTGDMTFAKVYAIENPLYFKEIQQLNDLNSAKFTVSDDWIIYLHTSIKPRWFARDFLAKDYSKHVVIHHDALRGPFVRRNLVVWHYGSPSDVRFKNLITDTEQQQILLSFSDKKPIDLIEIQDDIFYFENRHGVYAVDLLTLGRVSLALPGYSNKINYYKNRFVISQYKREYNRDYTELHLYEVSF